MYLITVATRNVIHVTTQNVINSHYYIYILPQYQLVFVKYTTQNGISSLFSEFKLTILLGMHNVKRFPKRKKYP